MDSIIFPLCVFISVWAMVGLVQILIWIKNKKTQKSIETYIESIKSIYIPFKGAVKFMFNSGYYEYNEQDLMNQLERITPEAYYRQLLIIKIKKKEICLYARKINGPNSEMQKIDVNQFKKLYLETDCNFLSTPIYSQDRENVYTDLSFEENELNLLLENLKKTNNTNV